MRQELGTQKDPAKQTGAAAFLYLAEQMKLALIKPIPVTPLKPAKGRKPKR
ncbi:MAG TPA: hypothetical protein VG944_24725 [Fimbriimonas sp.]|nr:hypothetical protein [Fimbriimonas sp.]